MNSALSKPHALIIGASSGIGYAVAERLQPLYKLSVFARRLDRLSVLAQKGALPYQCDVKNLESIAPAIEKSIEVNGKISALIYCAGQQLIKPMRSIKGSEVQEILSANLAAPLLIGGLMARQRYSENDSVYCLISSVAAQRPAAGSVPYSAAKAGIEAMIKGLASEIGPRRVVGVAPGWLDTEMTQSFPQVYTEDFKENLIKTSPLGIASVDAIVDAVCFLISSEAKYITGHILTIDGGASLK